MSDTVQKPQVYRLPDGRYAAHCIECGNVSDYPTWEAAMSAANVYATIHSIRRALADAVRRAFIGRT